MTTLESLAAALPATYRDDVDDDRLARMTLAMLTPPGDPTVGSLVLQTGAESALQTVLDGRLSQTGTDAHVGGVTPLRARYLAGALKVALTATQSLSLSVITPESGVWPRSLGRLGDSAPIALWVAGNAQLLNSAALTSVIGGRTGTLPGRERARQLAGGLAKLGQTLVSPGSFGTDATVIEAALDAGGKVIVILGGGLDHPRPLEHMQLFDRVLAAGGARVSEVPPGSRTTSDSSLARHRLIAVLAPRMVVAEASRHSAAVAAARIADQLGTAVAAIGGDVGHEASAGSHELVRDRTAYLVTNARETLQLNRRASVRAATPSDTCS